MNTTTLPKNRHSRKTKNYLLYPKVQLKYASLFCGLIFLLGLLFIGLQVIWNSEILSNLPSQEVVDAVSILQARNLILQCIVLFFSTLVIFFIIVVILHRFMGPMVPIIRYFEELRIHGKANSIKLRGEDELEPLVTYLESVDITVSQKSSV